MVCSTAGSSGSSTGSPAQPGQEPVRPVAQPRGALGRRQRLGAVDDLVGVAGEAVQRVHVRALPGGQQPGRQVVGAAVPAVQLPAAAVRLRQLGGDRGALLGAAHAGTRPRLGTAGRIRRSTAVRHIHLSHRRPPAHPRTSAQANPHPRRAAAPARRRAAGPAGGEDRCFRPRGEAGPSFRPEIAIMPCRRVKKGTFHNAER